MTRTDWHGRFTYLLALILFTLVLSSFIGDTETGRFVDRVLFSGVLLLGVAVATRRRQPLAVAVGLAILAAGATWVNSLLPDDLWVAMASHLLVIMVFVVTLAAILSNVLRRQRVTMETINGAICAYLLIGLTGAFLYSLLERFHPGSFRFTSAELLPDAGKHRYAFPQSGFPLLLYYSFVTLATVGYGDILPLTAPARMLSVLEAIVGQLYLVVLIARLVGMHIASAGPRDDGS